MLPALKSWVIATAEASQVGALRLGKGQFGLLIRERDMHFHKPSVFDGRGMAGKANGSSLCSWFECVVGLSLCGTQFSLLVVSYFVTWQATMNRSPHNQDRF